MGLAAKQFMQIAYDEAVLAAERGEVPIGAVLVDSEGNILAQDGNRTIERSDPSAHAEINVLREAGKKLGNYRLTGTSLYVTLEPCAMCMGAMVHARVANLVYAANDPKTGAAQSKYEIGSDGKLNHIINVDSGPMAEECSQLLRFFFKDRRK